MGYHKEACDECTQNCLLIHKRKRDPSPVVTSFFKVMIGSEFSEVLFVPPKFARTLAPLINKETCLEDSCGRLWNTALSKYKGTLAFRKGWHDFSMDHNLEVGDFVVVHYIMESHFIVQIYGKTGCEKLNFAPNGTLPNKRAKTTINSILSSPHRKEATKRDDFSGTSVSRSDLHMDILPLVPANGSNSGGSKEQIFTTPAQIEESYFMINRDQKFVEQEDQNPLFDLASFEMLGIKANTSKNNKIQGAENEIGLPSNGPGTQGGCESMLQMEETNNEGLDELAQSSGSDCNEVSEIKTSNDSRETGKGENTIMKNRGNGETPVKVLPPISVAKSMEHWRDFTGNDEVDGEKTDPRMTHEVVLSLQHETAAITSATQHSTSGNENAPRKMITRSKSSDFPPLRSCSQQQGRKLKVAKREPIEWVEVPRDSVAKNGSLGTPWTEPKTQFDITNEPKTGVSESSPYKSSGVGDVDMVDKMVKKEAVEFLDSSSATLAVSSTCVVKDDTSSFLDLPEGIPSIPYRRTTKLQQAVVFLRDPSMRRWAVMYLQRQNSRLLTSGWRQFREANGIKKGDELKFLVEDEADNLYDVQIVHPSEE